MITLCMDTSNLYLGIGIFEDDNLLDCICEPCFKKQSEEIFPKLQELMYKNKLEAKDIDQVVITRGPGSYTGIRIAMTIAKVFCKLANKKLYTVNSLCLYAGNKTCRVIIDARGKRVYTARYEKGVEIEAPCIKGVDKIYREEYEIIGDGELIGRSNNWPNYINNFMLVKEHWKLEENIDLVVPEYLKESDSYMVNK